MIKDLELLPSLIQVEGLRQCCAWSRQVYNEVLDLVVQEPGCEKLDWDVETLYKRFGKNYEGIPREIVRGSLQYLSSVLAENLGHDYWNANQSHWDTDSRDFFLIDPIPGVTVTGRGATIPTVGDIPFVRENEDIRGVVYVAISNAEHPYLNTSEGIWGASLVIGE